MYFKRKIDDALIQWKNVKQILSCQSVLRLLLLTAYGTDHFSIELRHHQFFF